MRGVKLILNSVDMNREYQQYSSAIDTYRSASMLFLCLSIVSLLFYETGFGGLTDWAPSAAVPVVLALLGIGFRLVAIDMALRARSLKEYLERNPLNEE